jgi:hypothetical protein
MMTNTTIEKLNSAMKWFTKAADPNNPESVKKDEVTSE